MKVLQHYAGRIHAGLQAAYTFMVIPANVVIMVALKCKKNESTMLYALISIGSLCCAELSCSWAVNVAA